MGDNTEYTWPGFRAEAELQKQARIVVSMLRTTYGKSGCIYDPKNHQETLEAYEDRLKMCQFDRLRTDASNPDHFQEALSIENGWKKIVDDLRKLGQEFTKTEQANQQPAC